jgi:hypothetical protein
MTFPDSSRLIVPHVWTGRVTDLEVGRGLAEALMTSRRSLAAMVTGSAAKADMACRELEGVAINEAFYRREPHLMRRYSTLAWDNIRRDPAGFALASAYRAGRLFIVSGSSDRQTVQQFSRSGLVYAVATGASAVYVVTFLAGVAAAWHARLRFWFPLALILYIPATISPVLTNMRYTITVQPLIFMFIAQALTARVTPSVRRTALQP